MSILITGASSGIGRQLALDYAEKVNVSLFAGVTRVRLRKCSLSILSL
jgi:short-subunit dehydrogenase